MPRPLRRTLPALLSTPPASAADAKPPVTLIKEVAAFDGEARLPARTILLCDGKIASADFRGALPTGAVVVDGRGKTLLPGLIDSHVHAYRDDELPLRFGVTTQRDMCMPVAGLQAAKARMAKGENHHYPDLVLTNIEISSLPGRSATGSSGRSWLSSPPSAVPVTCAAHSTRGSPAIC